MARGRRVRVVAQWRNELDVDQFAAALLAWAMQRLQAERPGHGTDSAHRDTRDDNREAA